jgi:putative CocE/NonD family hydrolase
MPTRRLLVVSALIVFALVHAAAQDAAPPADAYVRAHYTKHDHMIRMRDGVSLFTSVYLPKDRSIKYPIVLIRTPYSVAPYGVDQYRPVIGPSEHFMKDGFIVVYQDVRGRYMSEGEWTEVRPHNPGKGPKDIDESTDAWDTIEWLVRQVPANNGKVGMWGISYPGFYVSAGMIDAHPALVAASPQAPVTDYYLGDDSFHNGAFLLAHNFGFYTRFAPRDGGPATPATQPPFDWGTPDGYEFYLKMGPLSNSNTKYLKGANPYWNISLDHPTYDAFWQARSIWKHFRNITPAVLTVGGWYDAEDLAGPLRTYRTVEQASPGATNTIVMGPWTHGSWSRGTGESVGHVTFGAKTAEWYREHVEFPFFVKHLKGREAGAIPEALMFAAGVNEWRRHDTWPPKTARKKTLYFDADSTLVWHAPIGDGADEYLADPGRPVPLVGYTAQGMPGDYMTSDQRFAATRPDVLVYETPPLTEDVTVAGPIAVTLHVSSTGTDADFVVKLIDVYPGDYPSRDLPAGSPGYPVKMGGYQQLVRGEPFRAKYRNSFEKPEPLVPGQPATIAFEMPDAYHTFRRGHRIMVHVQSSWFPFVDRNPQTFVNIPTATEADFRTQTHRVYRSAARPSGVTVLVEP